MFFISGHSGVLVNSPVQLEIKGPRDKRSEILTSPINCGSIHQSHEWFSDDSRGRRDFYVSNFANNFANGGAKILIKSFLMRSFYFQTCIQQQGSARQKCFHCE